MTWYTKQRPTGPRWLCWFGFHQWFQTGIPTRHFCPRCHHLSKKEIP